MARSLLSQGTLAQTVLRMGYVYDASTRSYRQTATTATKAASGVSKTTAKIFSKVGSQLAPTATFYQSSAKVTISPQAKQLASGVKTKFDDAIKSTTLQNATIYLERPVTTNGTTSQVRGVDLLSQLTSAEFDQLANLAQRTGVSFRFPPGTTNTIDLTALKKIATDAKADVSEIKSVLARFDGNFAISVSESDLGASGTSAALLQAIKDTLGKSNRISTLSIYDQNGAKQSVSLTADTISKLGPNVWAKFSGPIAVRDSVANISNQWSDLRVLNNFKTLSVATHDGIAANNQFASDLKSFDFSLDYQSFVSGYNFLKDITRSPEVVSLSQSVNTVSDQSYLISGKLRNRDAFSLSVTTINPAQSFNLTVPPLVITPTATSSDRMAILANALKSAIAAEPTLSDLTVSQTGNKISFTSASANLSKIVLKQDEAGENDTTNFVDVTNVPIYALSSLRNASEVRSISLSTNSAGLKSNWDLISAFNKSRPLKNIILSDRQDIALTAQDLKKYLPVIEKIEGTQFRVYDEPFAMSTYAGFTEKAASKLSSSVDLTGSVSDFVQAASGIASLSKAGKLRSLEIKGAEDTVIPLDVQSALSLASVLDGIKDKLKIQITDKISLSEAALLAKKGIAQSLVGPITIESDGSDLTSDNVRDAKTLSRETLTVTRPVTMASALILTDLAVKPTAPLKIQDYVANVLAKSATIDASLIDTIVLTNAATLPQAVSLKGLSFAPKILSGIRISDEFATIQNGITNLKAIRTAGLLREVAVPAATSDANFATLQSSLAAENLASYLTRATV